MYNDEPVRDFKVEMESFTRRGEPVYSVYYIRERHILKARDTARSKASGRGLRKIRVIKVTDTLNQ
ncbi:hypothetical protein [Citrobacter braakii]|uniref:hypothetical protein n=1 Tax=Citrobacter braakii TaxID=57706 RepID=UPI00351CCE7D